MKTIQKNPAAIALISLLALTTTAAIGATAAGTAASSGASTTTTNPVNVPSTMGSGGNPASAMGAEALGSMPAAPYTTTTNPAVTGATPGVVTGNPAETIGMRREREQMEANAANPPAVPATGNDLTGANGATGTFSAAPATARSIRETTFETRDQLDSNVNGTVSDGRRAMIDAQTRAGRLNERDRANFNAAVSEVALRERQLQASTQAADNATSENWEQARAQLAADHDAYVQAVAQAQARAAAAGTAGNDAR